MRRTGKKKRAPAANRSSPAAKQSAYQQLRLVLDEDIRNLVRGMIAGNKEALVTVASINGLRKKAGGADLAQATEIVMGSAGAFPFPNVGSTYRALLRPHALVTITPKNEAAFISGHVNGWRDLALEITAAIKAFSALPASTPADAMQALAVFAERFGASSYLAKKVAYLMARFGEDSALQTEATKIANIVEQSKFPAPYFTAVEAIDTEFSYFPMASTRVQVSSRFIDGDFRQILPLHDLVPVPLTPEDAAAHLRKSHSMSLVDEIVSLIIVINRKSELAEVSDSICEHLDPKILSAIDDCCATDFPSQLLYDDCSPLEADITYYRRALAFVEFDAPSRYRAFVDQVVAPRLLPTYLNKAGQSAFHRATSVRDLTRALHGFKQPTDYLSRQNSGTFLRTVHLLGYMESQPGAHGLDQHDIRFLFEHTLALDVLLTEGEIERLYMSADEDSKLLVTVLALALHKAKSHDEDVDFKFRYTLAQNIIQKFHGSVVEFIEWLVISTPEIAHFLLYTLDRITLQKLYWVITTADEADIARQQILRTVGKVKNSIAYFVEADSIEAQRQVAKLQRYFDDSRIYVDGVALRKWLIENPSSYGQQYMRMIELNVPSISAKTTTIENGRTVSNVVDIPTITAFDYVLVEVAQIAFEQFCTNRDFGIESYLGRRIRHNTLTGMMRGGAEDIVESIQFRVLTYDDDFMAANDRWIEEYRSFIETIRREILQFKSDSRPKGIFNYKLGDDEETKSNIAALRNKMLAARNQELFNDLLIRFCWQEIDSQLIFATKYITVDLLNMALSQLDKHFSAYNSDLQLQYRTVVHNALHERFTRLGSWFRQPQDGFVSASTRQLGDLILVEAANGIPLAAGPIQWSGNAADLVLDGLSVHRVYDCLFVLVRNAIKHGDQKQAIEIVVDDYIQNREVALLNISVRSSIKSGEDASFHRQRLEESFARDDLGTAMVLEGYSGIRKLRYITKINEGREVASYDVSDGFCSVSFGLTVEVAIQEQPEL